MIESSTYAPIVTAPVDPTLPTAQAQDNRPGHFASTFDGARLQAPPQVSTRNAWQDFDENWLPSDDIKWDDRLASAPSGPAQWQNSTRATFSVQGNATLAFELRTDGARSGAYPSSLNGVPGARVAPAPTAPGVSYAAGTGVRSEQLPSWQRPVQRLDGGDPFRARLSKVDLKSQPPQTRSIFDSILNQIIGGATKGKLIVKDGMLQGARQATIPAAGMLESVPSRGNLIDEWSRTAQNGDADWNVFMNEKVAAALDSVKTYVIAGLMSEFVGKLRLLPDADKLPALKCILRDPARNGVDAVQGWADEIESFFPEDQRDALKSLLRDYKIIA
ncbi:hypothetical protein [Pandoraea sp. ISTKB]|uniref:hypothetical protein n=1 Tax=Pandoraea sp. ISTKB TaxID=1586708 RepID=UPI000846E11B|nr:hypothetical protein [Pandoraea sp. ISTKB]ODP30972.1 hypothetical protein A9762_07930 [Pandoraea sp. ISTKB]